MEKRWRRRLIRLFGTLLALGALSYGAGLLAGGSGVGPCRINCGFQTAFIAAMGQPAYNLTYGLIWVATGIAFLVFTWRVSDR